MKRLLLSLSLLLALGVGAQPLPAENKPTSDWMRLVELDSAASLRSALLRGQDPNVMDHRGQRALHWALMHESAKAVDVLLAAPQTDVNARNQAGERPIWLAAMRGRADWLRALLARGAQLETGPQIAKAWTTLHYAVLAPNTEVLQLLLARKDLDLNAPSDNASTPLMMALGYGSLDAAELLVKAGADRQRRNDLGLSAWDFAKRAGREDFAARLGLGPGVSEKD